MVGLREEYVRRPHSVQSMATGEAARLTTGHIGLDPFPDIRNVAVSPVRPAGG